ncbi:hypothetical protein SteCoe_10555 [Stentor coeruleus]|uniref:Uncharacterized protein n=1 Tax=Stentor coeruleus TaxID=5963 RepID=A0A1R2CFB9_9CILI|nr:hypothetical protein SteCoe_10555 [Stentor coeruleus]
MGLGDKIEESASTESEQKAYDVVEEQKSNSFVVAPRPLDPCLQNTRYFIKDGVFLSWPGGRSGACGSRKDGRRMYICRECWFRGVRL